MGVKSAISYTMKNICAYKTLSNQRLHTNIDFFGMMRNFMKKICYSHAVINNVSNTADSLHLH